MRQFLILAKRFVERLARGLSGRTSVRNLPLYFAGADFVLRDAARFTGVGVDHRRGAGLELPRAPRCHQDVAIVAVKSLDQLHCDSPLNPILRPDVMPGVSRRTSIL